MTAWRRSLAASAPAFRKNAITMLRALYVGGRLAAYLAAVLWIASRRP